MGICFVCRDAIHPHQAEPAAVMTIQHGTAARRYTLCGDGAQRIVAGVIRRRSRTVGALAVTIARELRP
jgi:hypothetical protein